MKKIIISGNGEKQFSSMTDEKPVASGYDILVQVKAGAINPVDTKVRATFDGDTKTLGYDAAGIVVGVGESVVNIELGNEVYYAGDILREGSNAEFQLVDSRIVAKRPQNLSWEEAAALPLTTITAYEALFDRMRIYEENFGSVLIIGGAGGVGSIAIQLLKAKTECTVIATASRPESNAWCRDLGADWIIDHTKPLKPQLEDIGIGEVEFILCANDTTFHWNNMVESIAPQGKICSIVDNTEPVMINDLKKKSASFIWEFMFTRPVYKTKDLIRQSLLLEEVTRLVEIGAVRTTFHESLGTLSVETIEEGHRKIAEGHSIGKMTYTV